MKVFVINGYPNSGKDTFVTYCKNLLKEKNIPAYDFSTITPIKLVARQLGWEGQKDPASRKMLANIKAALTEWNDYTFNYIKKAIRDMESANRPTGLDFKIRELGISLFNNNDMFRTYSDILLQLEDIEDVEEIQDFKNKSEKVKKEIKALNNYKEPVFFIYCREPEEIEKFVKRLDASTILIDRAVPENFSNDADKNVMNYHYDYIVENNGSLDTLRKSAKTFLECLEII